MDNVFDLVIIGGGVTGLAAGMYAGRLNMRTAIFSEKTGGTIILTDVVENYPGFKSLTGQELADKIKEHMLEYDVDLVEERVDEITIQKNYFVIKAGGKTYSTKTIIFATGTEWRKLNVPGEDTFANRGVHYCALCDGAFYKNKTIGVVGGSDSAAKEALLLSQWASKVYIIYRGEKIRAEPINAKKVAENKKIEIINNTNITEIRGDKKLTHVIFDKPHNGKKEFPLDGLFVEIGHIPISGLAKKINVKTNEKGEIIIDREAKTNVQGVFAAGDVADTKFKQAITGVGEAVTAVYSAYGFMNENNVVHPKGDENHDNKKRKNK